MVKQSQSTTERTGTTHTITHAITNINISTLYKCGSIKKFAKLLKTQTQLTIKQWIDNSTDCQKQPSWQGWGGDCFGFCPLTICEESKIYWSLRFWWCWSTQSPLQCGDALTKLVDFNCSLCIHNNTNFASPQKNWMN